MILEKIRRWGQRGSVTTYTLLMVPLGLIGLSAVTTVGDFYFQRAAMQSATDAAAIAGAHYLLEASGKLNNNATKLPRAKEQELIKECNAYIEKNMTDGSKREADKVSYHLAGGMGQQSYVQVMLKKDLKFFFHDLMQGLGIDAPVFPAEVKSRAAFGNNVPPVASVDMPLLLLLPPMPYYHQMQQSGDVTLTLRPADAYTVSSAGGKRHRIYGVVPMYSVFDVSSETYSPLMREGKYNEPINYDLGIYEHRNSSRGSSYYGSQVGGTFVERMGPFWEDYKDWLRGWRKDGRKFEVPREKYFEGMRILGPDIVHTESGSAVQPVMRDAIRDALKERIEAAKALEAQGVVLNQTNDPRYIVLRVRRSTLAHNYYTYEGNCNKYTYRQDDTRYPRTTPVDGTHRDTLWYERANFVDAIRLGQPQIFRGVYVSTNGNNVQNGPFTTDSVHCGAGDATFVGRPKSNEGIKDVPHDSMEAQEADKLLDRDGRFEKYSRYHRESPFTRDYPSGTYNTFVLIKVKSVDNGSYPSDIAGDPSAGLVPPGPSRSEKDEYTDWQTDGRPPYPGRWYGKRYVDTYTVWSEKFMMYNLEIHGTVEGTFYHRNEYDEYNRRRKENYEISSSSTGGEEKKIYLVPALSDT